MTDRELLELAAKAIGLSVHWDEESSLYWIDNPDLGLWFDPLVNDADAFRLMVELDIRVEQHRGMVKVDFPCHDEEFNERKVICETVLDDRAKATRRAITRAAAEIQLAKEALCKN